MEEQHAMIRNSVKQLSVEIPQTLRNLEDQLTSMGEPCVSDIEKKSLFDKIVHKMAPRIRQLLNGASEADDSDTMLINLKMQQFMKTFDEKFKEGGKMVWSPEFRERMQKSFGEL